MHIDIFSPRDIRAETRACGGTAKVLRVRLGCRFDEYGPDDELTLYAESDDQFSRFQRIADAITAINAEFDAHAERVVAEAEREAARADAEAAFTLQAAE